MSSDNQITIVGNLTDDPELRYTSNGAAVANFRVAYSTRIRDAAGNWTDGETSFFTVNCWRALAENAAESLTRGTRVVVTGRLKQRSWENQEGEKRTVIEIEADDLGPSLKWATANVTKANRSSTSSGGSDWGAAVAGPVGAGSNEETPLDAGEARQVEATKERQRRQVAEEGQAQVLHLLQGQDRLRRLQGPLDAPEVHLRARQDPRAAGDGQLRPASARRGPGR